MNNSGQHWLCGVFANVGNSYSHAFCSQLQEQRERRRNPASLAETVSNLQGGLSGSSGSLPGNCLSEPLSSTSFPQRVAKCCLTPSLLFAFNVPRLNRDARPGNEHNCSLFVQQIRVIFFLYNAL